MVISAIVGKVRYTVQLIPETNETGEVEETTDIRAIREEDWDRFAKSLGYKTEEICKDK